jgi:MerR family transcriptional regulator/heat shock protein HspR
MESLMNPSAEDRGMYVISVAARRAGMHPQTLRIYERRGLLQPARTQGGNRRYSEGDIARLRRIAELTAEGVSVEGIRRIMRLENEVQRLRDEVDQLRLLAAEAIRAAQGQERESPRGGLVPLRQSVSVFGQVPSVLRRERGPRE